MTIREQIKKRVRFCFLLALLSWALMAAIMLFTSGQYLLCALIGFAGMMGPIIYLTMFVRCPKCRLPLGQTSASLDLNPVAKHQLNYCPNCGLDLTEEA